MQILFQVFKNCYPPYLPAKYLNVLDSITLIRGAHAST